jgi:acyl carrier protein
MQAATNEKISLLEAIRRKADELCGREVTVDQALWSTHLLDSLQRAELAFYVAELAGFEIEPMDVCLENFESIHHILLFINKKGLLNK